MSRQWTCPQSDQNAKAKASTLCSVHSRPDVAYAVGMLSRAMGKPTPELYEDALTVLMYLDRHKEVGLHYSKDHLQICTG